MKRSGFTVIEMVAALVILGIIAIVIINKNPLDPNLIVESEILKSHLRYIQFKALSDDSCDNCYGLTISSNSYAAKPTTLILPGDQSSTHDLSKNNISITGTNITFDRWGSASATKTISFTLSDNKGNSQTITISSMAGLIE